MFILLRSLEVIILELIELKKKMLHYNCVHRTSFIVKTNRIKNKLSRKAQRPKPIIMGEDCINIEHYVFMGKKYSI